MTNESMLRQKIEASGYKILFIVSQLGITYQGFQNKIHNRTEFKAGEIKLLSELLNLTADETRQIFLS